MAMRIFENVKDAGRTPADIEFAAVFAEGETVERLRERKELGDLSRGRIDECDTLLIVAAVDGKQAGFVGREDELVSHVCDGHVLAGGRCAPAVEEKAFVGFETAARANGRRVYVFARFANAQIIGGKRGGERQGEMKRQNERTVHAWRFSKFP